VLSRHLLNFHSSTVPVTILPRKAVGLSIRGEIISLSSSSSSDGELRADPGDCELAPPTLPASIDGAPVIVRRPVTS
jgi:hypothetical protein